MNRLAIFTICLDAMPFLPAQFYTFSRLALDIDWTWYIAHGAAANTGSTKWCRPQKARLSTDGTTEFLNSIRSHPRVHIQEMPWWKGGKDHMVNSLLLEIQEPCILLQVDADEMFSTEQIEGIMRMFAENPQSNCARFDHVYYTGPNIVVSSQNTWGGRHGEFLRAWRFSPGMTMRHEPPHLYGVNEPQNEVCLWNKETRARGLVAHHFAYVFESQVAFKQEFYGYDGAVFHFRRLQNHKSPWPTALKEFFSWADEGCMVDLLHKP